MALIEKLNAIGDAIREKTGGTDKLTLDGMVEAIAGIQSGGSGGGSGGAGVAEKEVNFYDYDGTCLYAYTVAEAQALDELPAGPKHGGLVFQKWNWSLENVKALTRPMNIGALYTTDDGTTRIYIHLEEGRTSPMLGVGVNGTVTVDWGDGTEPDVLTGTKLSTVQWTPTHEYSAPGDYVISLMVDGAIGFTSVASTNQYACILRHSSSADTRNTVYQNSVRRIECGEGVTAFLERALWGCNSLKIITMPNNTMDINEYAFAYCCALLSITIPDDASLNGGNIFNTCRSLASAMLPENVTNIDSGTFKYCGSLKSITLPDSTTKIGSEAFEECYSLAAVSLPENATTLNGDAFSMCETLAMIKFPNGIQELKTYTCGNCKSLASIKIPDSVTKIGSNVFANCYNLSAVTLPQAITSIGGNAFYNCCGVRYYDFSKHTAVPTLSSANAFSGVPADCEIRVPAALYDEWIAATNWATYASQIVAV